MADLVLLPSTTYRAPSPQDRRKGASLNTIIEEEYEDLHAARRSASRPARDGQPARSVEQWLSPLSDHFPTPRGFHFLSAPVVPSTPSAASETDDDCDAQDTGSEVSSSDASSLQRWNNRGSVATDSTDSTDFDNMSDLDDDDGRKEQLRANGIARKSTSGGTRSSWRASRAPAPESRKTLARLVIPARRDSATQEARSAASRAAKKAESPIPPTPPSHVELSPAQLAFMRTQQESEVPTISAPPSLDGSLNSEELAAMSAPPTPLIGAKDDGDDDNDRDWAGVQLQPGALATLQALSGGDEPAETQPAEVIELPPQEEMSESRQQPPRLITNGLSTTNASTSAASGSAAFSTFPPAQQRSLAGLTKLDIPSPGGFFSDLSSASRSTWNLSELSADGAAPPTSTTAEQFYKTPWNARSDSLPPPPPPARPLHMESPDHPSTVVEQVVEMPREGLEDLPTAFRIQPTPQPITARRVTSPSNAQPPHSARAAPPQDPATDSHPAQPSSPVDATEIVADYDPNYARRQQEAALSHLDRTELWLLAQRAYLQGVVDPNREKEVADDKHQEAKSKLDESDVGPEVPPKDYEVAKDEETESSAPQNKKKTVRFSEAVQTTNIPARLPSKLLRRESAYYRAFTDLIVRSHRSDAFVHRLPRFEALQAQRVSLREAHRDQLLGKYQLSVVPQSAKKRMSANVARGDDTVAADTPEKLRADKEREALAHMSVAAWHVAASKLLNGGRLLTAPVAKRLLAAPAATSTATATTGSGDRARILDLGGQGTCDWAWHAALAFPSAKVYTVTTKAIRQLSNSNIRGPPNHRQVAVDALARLPFADAHFDLVSARELHSVLKLVGESGEDQWDACLAECLRVLKPGGYLEFSLLDSDIVNAGPLGLARSVELGFTLQTLGYDPAPTRAFLPRLRRAGFSAVRRAWVCLPVGPKPRSVVAAAAGAVPRDPNTGLPVPTVELEAMVSGSADAAAAAAGLAAGWSWERWVLRTEMDKAAAELRLGDAAVTAGPKLDEAARGISGVHAIIEEGRARGAAFRMLRGYARKPALEDDGPATGVIDIALDA